MTYLYIEYEPVSPYLDDAKRELFASRLPEARAARIRSPRLVQKRAERAAAEAALRRVLRRAGEAYTAIKIAYTDTGKPYIDGRADLSVSISHTATLAAVSLVKSEDGIAPQIGIDIAEEGSAPPHAASLVSRYFSQDELAQYHSESQGDAEKQGTSSTNNDIVPPTDENAFLSAWCRMEARVKMTGDGIGGTTSTREPADTRRTTVCLPGGKRHFVAVALSAPATDANI